MRELFTISKNKKLKKFIIYIIILIGLLIIFSIAWIVYNNPFGPTPGGEEHDEVKFFGTWTIFGDNDNITFCPNGTFSRGEYVNGTYSITDGRLVLDTTDNTPGTHPDNRKFIAIYNYVFSDNDKTLILEIPGEALRWICLKQ